MTFLDGFRIGAAAYEMTLIGYTYFLLLHRRFGKRISYLIFTIIGILSCIKHFIFYDRMEIRTVMQFTLCFIALFVLFTDSVFKKLGVFVLYTGTAVVVESLCMMVGVLLLGQDFFESQSFHPAFLFVDLMITTILLVLAVHKLSHKAIFESKAQRFIVIYCLIQFITALIMFIMLWDYKIQATPLMVFYLVMLFSSIAFGIYLLRMVRTASAEQARADRMALQVKLANEHFGRLQVQYEQYRKLRHDYYNHINVIRNITDTEKREAYIDELTHKIEDRNGIAFCSNAALDALLFNEKAQADAAGVKITYKIGDLSEVKIPDLDICTVLSNLLDNAVRGASECESERFVELVMTVSAGQLVIRVTNSAVAPKEDLSTTKKDKDSHGLGLSIVRETAEKYHGAAVWSYENGVFCCTFSAQA